MPESYNWYERDWLECAESAYDNNAILSFSPSILHMIPDEWN